MSLAVVQSDVGQLTGGGAFTVTLAAEPTPGNALLFGWVEHLSLDVDAYVDLPVYDDHAWVFGASSVLQSAYPLRCNTGFYVRPVGMGDDLAALQSFTLTLGASSTHSLVAFYVEVSGLGEVNPGTMNFSYTTEVATGVSAGAVPGLVRNLPTLGFAAWTVVGSAVSAVTVDADATLATFVAEGTGDLSIGAAVSIRADGGTGDLSFDWAQSAGFAMTAALVAPNYGSSGWYCPVWSDGHYSTFTGTLIADVGEYVGPWPLPQPTQALLESAPDARELDYWVGLQADDHTIAHTFRYGYYADPYTPVFDAYSYWSVYPPGIGDVPTSAYFLTSVGSTADPSSPSDPHPTGAHLILQWTGDWSDVYSPYFPPSAPSVALADLFDPSWARPFSFSPVAGSTYSEIATGQPHLLFAVAGSTAVSVAGVVLGLISGAPSAVRGRTNVVFADTPADVELSGNPPIALGLQLRGTATVDDENDPEAVDGSLVEA